MGLLGGVGSGKSTVARLFAARGARVLDADRIAHAVLQSPAVRRAIRARWGAGVFRAGGWVDRAALGRRVFGDARGLRALERLIHPRVAARIAAEVRRRRGPVVLDVPLLLESPALARLCDRLVFVHAPAAVRARRAARARGWAPGEVARRERFQAGLAAKRRRADAVIDNGGPPVRTRRQVDRLLERFHALNI